MAWTEKARNTKYKKRCLKCGKLFTPTSHNQKYCGSDRKKEGCSYVRRLEGYRELDKKRRPRKYPRIAICKKCGKEMAKQTGRQLYCKNCSVKIKKNKKRIERQATRLQLRFQIFQRDNFACQYCGRKPPEVELQIDHKYPKRENEHYNFLEKFVYPGDHGKYGHKKWPV